MGKKFIGIGAVFAGLAAGVIVGTVDYGISKSVVRLQRDHSWFIYFEYAFISILAALLVGYIFRMFHKQLETKMLELDGIKASYEGIIEGTWDSIVTLDRSGKVILWSKGAEKLYGFKKSEVMGKIPQVELPGQKTIFELFTGEVREDKKPLSFETVKKTKSGDTLNILVTVFPILDENKELLGFTTVHKNLTELKRLEREVRSTEDRYRTLFEHSTSGTVVVGNDTVIETVNTEFEKITGYSKDEIEGKKSFTDLLPPREKERIVGYHKARRESGDTTAPSEYEATIITKSGEEKTIHAAVRLIPNTDKSIASIMDISVEKKLREEILRRNKDLSALYSLADMASQSFELDVVLNHGLEKVLSVMGTEEAAIYLLDEKKENLRLAAQIGFPEEVVKAVSILRVGEGIAGRVAQTGRHEIVENLSKDPRVTTPIAKKMEAKEYACVPLSAKNSLIGVLSCGGRKGIKFAEEDVELLRSMGTQIAIALQNAKLFEEKERRIAQLAALSRIGQAISSTLKLDDLVALVHSQVSTLMDAGSFYIALFDREKDEISFSYDVREGRKMPGRARRKFSNGLTEYIIRTGRPLSIPANVSGKCEELGIEPAGKMAKSWMGVPIVSLEKVTGVIAVQSYEKENTYTSEDLELLSTLASQAGAAIENARLYDDTAFKVKEIAALHEVGKILMRIMSPREAAKEIMQVVCEVFKGCPSYLLLADQESSELKAAGGCCVSEELLRKEAGIGKDGVSNWVAKHLHAQSVPDVSKDERYVEHIQGVKSMVAVPVLKGEKLLGVLNVQSYETNAFEEKDVKLLTGVAQQLAMGIEMGTLYATLEKRVKDLDLLNQTSLRMVSGLSLEETLNTVVDELGETIGYKCCELCLTDESGNELIPQTRRGEADQCLAVSLALPPGARRLARSDCLGGKILDKGEIFSFSVSNCDEELKRLAQGCPVWVMGVPLHADGKPIGVLCLGRDEQFREDEKRTLSILANQIGIAVKNARLFEEVRLAYENLKSTQDELVKSERMTAVTQTVIALNHAINNPLASIVGNSQFVLMTKEKFDPGVVERMKRIEKDAQRIKEVTERMARLIEAAVTDYPGGEKMIDVDGSRAKEPSPAA